MDDKIEKLNVKISRLLGKSGNNTPNLGGSPDDEDSIGGFLYFVVTLFCIILLWLATGVHYISEGYFGLIVTNGRLQEVVQGPKLDISLPLPFTTVTMIDATATGMKNVTVDGSNDINYRDLTADNVEINVLAQFSYQITDPQKFYYKISIEKNNVDNLVRLNIVSAFHEYIRSYAYASLHTSNLTIMGNQIRSRVDKYLVQYGISIVKINISKLSSISADTNPVTADNSGVIHNSIVASELINEANAYKKDQLAKARANVDQYKILLAEYRKNPQTVVEQMYYDTLSGIPSTQTNDNYKLLFMPLSELLKLAQSNNFANQNSSFANVRTFNRNVERERDFGH